LRGIVTRIQSINRENNMNTTLRASILLAVLAIGSSAVAADSGKKGYLTDTRNDVVKSGFGLCWHTGFWTPADAIEGCDGGIAKAATAPAAEATTPAPVPAAETIAPVAATAPTSEKVSFSADAFFDFDQAVLKPEGKSKLTDLVAKLSGTDIEVIVATGHTDSVGSDAYNQKLSLRRAQAVKAFLVSKGIPPARVFTEGKGERQPVADNRSREGRAKNRRVEIEVVGKKKQ
jgi:OOP family OmpA-OmpF porin